MKKLEIAILLIINAWGLSTEISIYYLSFTANK